MGKNRDAVQANLAGFEAQGVIAGWRLKPLGIYEIGCIDGTVLTLSEKEAGLFIMGTGYGRTVEERLSQRERPGPATAGTTSDPVDATTADDVMALGTTVSSTEMTRDRPLDFAGERTADGLWHFTLGSSEPKVFDDHDAYLWLSGIRDLQTHLVLTRLFYPGTESPGVG